MEKKAEEIGRASRNPATGSAGPTSGRGTVPPHNDQHSGGRGTVPPHSNPPLDSTHVPASTTTTGTSHAPQLQTALLLPDQGVPVLPSLAPSTPLASVHTVSAHPSPASSVLAPSTSGLQAYQTTSCSGLQLSGLPQSSSAQLSRAAHQRFSPITDSDPSEGVSPKRGRKRHRSPVPSKKRRHHSSSSSSSSSSQSHRRRRRPKRRNKDSFPTEALSQLVSALTQSVNQLAAHNQNLGQNPAVSQTHTQAPVPVSSGLPSTSSTALHPREDQASNAVIQSSASASDLEHDQGFDMDFPSRDSTFNQDFHEDDHQSEEQHDSSEEEAPILGTEFSKEAFEKAVNIIRHQLGFPEESVPTPDPTRRSRLSLNKPSSSKRVSMPVDAECLDRFDAQASLNPWRAFPKRQASNFYVEEEHWKNFFAPPPVPPTCLDRLKATGATDAKGVFKSFPLRKSLKSWDGVDMAARTGLKFASSLLLLTEVLAKSFRQSSPEVSRKDTAALINFLSPVVRLSFDQFAKIAVRASRERREIILDSIRLPSDDIKRRFSELPCAGPDLFAGKFEEQWALEVKRKKDMNKADFNLIPDQRSSRPRRSPIRARRGNSNVSARSQPFSQSRGARSAPTFRQRPLGQPRRQYRQQTSFYRPALKRQPRGLSRGNARSGFQSQRP